MSFDVLADDRIANEKKDNWLFQATMSRRHAHNQKTLTDQRTAFITEHVLGNQNQGPAKSLPCRQREIPPVFFTARRKADEALAMFPRYSARLLLSIRLLTPLLTKDDDPFYLFDNPVRKDHILGLPCLSAAAIKGLAADAYQRAFPGIFIMDDFGDAIYVKANPYQRTLPNVPVWTGLGNDDPSRTHVFRRTDLHALRLFGIADDGTNTQVSQIGRLHFSPLWFDTVQFLVMNPGKKETATGDKPIQFEAIAPDAADKPNQTHEIELIYCNPYGAKDTDETQVRTDLARFLAALAVWWPALGIGAKRLAGYGAIEIVKAELQAVGWLGMGDAQSAATPVAPTVPEFVTRFTANGQLIDRDTLQAQCKEQREAWKRQPDVEALEQEKESLKLITNKNRRQKERDRINKQLDELRQPLDKSLQAQENAYAQAVTWLRDHPEWAGQADTTSAPPVTETPPMIGERMETGPDSWLNLARWIAGETA